MKWTNADTKRAERMGWYLRTGWLGRFKHLNNRISFIEDGPFKSDAEAIRFVVLQIADGESNFCKQEANYKTCVKAVLLCCSGGGK